MTHAARKKKGLGYYQAKSWRRNSLDSRPGAGVGDGQYKKGYKPYSNQKSGG